MDRGFAPLKFTLMTQFISNRSIYKSVICSRVPLIDEGKFDEVVNLAKAVV